MSDSNEKEPILEEGIGLRLEEVRNLLMMKHNLVVSPDDPILMLVTLNNAFLAEYERLFSKHETALGHFMASETEKYLDAILQLQEQLSHVAIEGLKETSEEHTRTLASTKRDLYWISGLVVVSAIVNIVILLVR